MKKQLEEMLSNLPAEDVLVTEGRADGTYPGPGEYLLKLLQPKQGRKNLYIYLLHNRITIIFGDWSTQFLQSENGLPRAIRCVQSIVNGDSCLYTATSSHGSICALMDTESVRFSNDDPYGLIRLLQNQEFLEDAARGEVQERLDFWN